MKTSAPNPLPPISPLLTTQGNQSTVVVFSYSGFFYSCKYVLKTKLGSYIVHTFYWPRILNRYSSILLHTSFFLKATISCVCVFFFTAERCLQLFYNLFLYKLLKRATSYYFET